MVIRILSIVAPWLSVAFLAALPGCATLTEGSAQTIHIETDPPGARCELMRNGQLVTRIPATPATISLYKETGDLQLSCRKPGYQDASLDTAADFQDMVLGNILFGGLIGVVIDMGSGATSKYPEAIILTLVPERFASTAERDVYFEQLRLRLNRRAEEQIARIRQRCETDGCEQQLAGIRAALDRQLALLARQQATATISP